MGLIRHLFKQTDRTADEFRKGLEASKLIHEVVFTTIQSMAIIAALQILLGKQFNYAFFGVLIAAYISLWLYLISFFNFVLRATAERFELVDRSKNVFLWVSGTLSLGFSYLVTSTIPDLVAAFVSTNFLQ